VVNNRLNEDENMTIITTLFMPIFLASFFGMISSSPSYPCVWTGEGVCAHDRDDDPIPRFVFMMKTSM
jgi:hypothetical protein